MLSIIIPNYNEEENLPNQLTFLEAKAKAFPIEIIIANSPDTTDSSLEICKSYDKVQFLESERSGRAIQMNFGASKAKGEILLFLHADIQLPDDFYEQITSAMDAGNQFGFFAYRFDRRSLMLNINSYFTKNDGMFAGAGDQAQFITKSAFERLGGFDESYCIMEDFKLTDTVRQHKLPYTIIQSRATVSARKYDKGSWLKVNLINGYVFLLYKLGTEPKKLRRIYKGLLREDF